MLRDDFNINALLLIQDTINGLDQYFWPPGNIDSII